MSSLSSSNFGCISRDSVHDSRDASKRTDVSAGGCISRISRIQGGSNLYGIKVGGGSSGGSCSVVGGKVGNFGSSNFRGVGNRLRYWSIWVA
jgi:hypothetical protein